MAYELPYAVGLQLIWAANTSAGEMMRAYRPDKGFGSGGKLKELMG